LIILDLRNWEWAVFATAKQCWRKLPRRFHRHHLIQQADSPSSWVSRDLRIGRCSRSIWQVLSDRLVRKPTKAIT